MREIRQSGGISLRRAAILSGRNKSHLSRVENGLVKPSLHLVEWYDAQFGDGNSLVGQYRDLDDPAPVAGTGDTRPPDGSVPADHDTRDGCALVAETMPDGTVVRPGTVLRKTWTLRNTGSVNWRGRWLTRQHTDTAEPGRLRCPTRVPVPDIGPGGEALIELDVTTPNHVGTCVAYFMLTDVDGRPYFPDPAIQPLHCSLYVSA
jgi:hypothetical protein